MKLSIITPTYNSGQFIEATIKSIHSQQNADFEHIVMDGGSTDNTPEIVKKYKKITYVRQPDKGQSDAINKGFAQATGHILAWQNADDLYLPGCFETVVSFFEQNPTVGLVYGYYNTINHNGDFVCTTYPIDFNLKKFKRGRYNFLQPTVFWRANVWQRFGPLQLNLHYCMDADFYAKAINGGVTVARIPKVLGAFRVHLQSKTQNPENHKKVRNEYYNVLKKHFDYSPLDTLFFNYYQQRSKLARWVKHNVLKK